MVHGNGKVLADLRNIRKGQKIVYFLGKNLAECPRDVVTQVRLLSVEDRIRTHLRRVSPPNSEDSLVNYTYGNGRFENIAIGC